MFRAHSYHAYGTERRPVNRGLPRTRREGVTLNSKLKYVEETIRHRRRIISLVPSRRGVVSLHFPPYPTQATLSLSLSLHRKSSLSLTLPSISLIPLSPSIELPFSLPIYLTDCLPPSLRPSIRPFLHASIHPSVPTSFPLSVPQPLPMRTNFSRPILPLSD